jgi:hypothetical protein
MKDFSGLRLGILGTSELLVLWRFLSFWGFGDFSALGGFLLGASLDSEFFHCFGNIGRARSGVEPR